MNNISFKHINRESRLVYQDVVKPPEDSAGTAKKVTIPFDYTVDISKKADDFRKEIGVEFKDGNQLYFPKISKYNKGNLVPIDDKTSKINVFIHKNQLHIHIIDKDGTKTEVQVDGKGEIQNVVVIKPEISHQNQPETTADSDNAELVLTRDLNMQEYNKSVARYNSDLRQFDAKDEEGKYKVSNERADLIKGEIKKLLGIPDSLDIGLNTHEKTNSVFSGNSKIVGDIFLSEKKNDSEKVAFTYDTSNGAQYLGGIEFSGDDFVKVMEKLESEKEDANKVFQFAGATAGKDSEVVIFSENDYNKIPYTDYKSSFRVYIGEPANMNELKITKTERSRGAGATKITGTDKQEKERIIILPVYTKNNPPTLDGKRLNKF